MIPEEIWYLFIFPWILFIANIPGAVITYMALGAVATFSAYIPGLGGSKDSWISDLNSDSINFKISCQKGWWFHHLFFSNCFQSSFLIIWIVPITGLLFRRFAGYKKLIAWNNKTRCRRLPVWSRRFRGISGDGIILPVKPRPSTLMAWRGNEKNIHFGCGTDGDRPDFPLPDRGWRRRILSSCLTDPGSTMRGLSWYLGRQRTLCRHDLGSQSMIRDRHEPLFISLKPL